MLTGILVPVKSYTLQSNILPMNNKILSLVLLAGIATTGFAGISAASNSQVNSKFRNKSEIRQIHDKLEAGESLTAQELEFLDAAKEKFHERAMKKWFDGFGKRAGFNELTQEEITALESMTDEEKRVFFAEKKAEKIAQKDAEKAVIDALIAGQTLSADQEALRLEMLARFDEDVAAKRDWAVIIEKILAGDELSADELVTLEEMQEKHAERQAKRAARGHRVHHEDDEENDN